MNKKILQSIWKQILCILLCLIVVAPFYIVLINSFKTKAEASRMSLALPTKWMFSNYTEVIEKGKLIQGFLNSMIYASVATLIGVILCAMAAFVLCRRRSRFNNFIYYFVIINIFSKTSYSIPAHFSF